MPASNTHAVLSVKVFSPSLTYFDGEAARLSATNNTGDFDILPLHHKFISLLREGTVRITTPKDKEVLVKITNGLLHVENNQVKVFLDV
jgi:F-type H+-transporting ATPase subunit epsilon